MIRHIVFFSAKDPKDREAIYDGLCLLKENPYADKFEIGRNLKSDTIAGQAVDFVVYSEFENEDALEKYKAHPTYEKSIQIVRPLRDFRISADFTSEVD